MRWLLLILVSQSAWAVSPELIELTRLFKDAYQTYAPLDLSGKSGLKWEEFRVRFVPLLNNRSGQCKPNQSPPLVELDINMWDSLNPVRKEIVFMHELAHCLVGRKHRNDVDKNGKRLSIMHEKGISPEDYLSAKDYYLEELFFHKDKEMQQ